MHVTWPSLEGCTDWIIGTKSVEPDLVSLSDSWDMGEDSSKKGSHVSLNSHFTPEANKHGAPETTSCSLPYFSPPGACFCELLITFKLLFDWRSLALWQVVSNGLISSLTLGDIWGLHMSITLPPPPTLTGAVSFSYRATTAPLRKSIWSFWNSLAMLSAWTSSSHFYFF